MSDANVDPKIPKLSIPAAATDAVRLTNTLVRPAAWAKRVVAQIAHAGPLTFSQGLVHRFDTRHAPGARAASFAKTLVPDPLRLDEVELTVSPYAPPMRQLGSVRQGVPMWRAAESRTPAPAPAARPPATAPMSRAAPPRKAKKDEIPADLIAILNMHRALGHVD